ncbi:MAG: DUF4097 family beta strand repeat-containing protein [Ruthenibacterium sp.]
MKTFLKFLLGLAGFACVAGIALSIAGFCMGGRITNMELRWNDGRPRIVYSDFNDNAPVQDSKNTPVGFVQGADINGDIAEIRGLSLDIDAAVVEIARGSTYSLAVTSGTNYHDKVDEDGIWEIESENNFSNDLHADIVFQITVPSDIVLDEFEVSLGAGELTAYNLACKKADLEAGAGTMTLTDFSCADGARLNVAAGSIVADGTLSGETRIKCALGEVTLNVAQSADYGYDIECGAGSVRIGDNSFSGLAKDMKHNKNAADFYKIDCGMGNVNISFE